jgi:Fe-S cluster assembly protein SufD
MFIQNFTIRTCSHKNFEKKDSQQKDEAWKYTSLNALLKNDFTVFPKHESAEFSQVRKYFLHEVDTYKVVFVDGVFSSYLSSTTQRNRCLLNVFGIEQAQIQNDY